MDACAADVVVYPDYRPSNPYQTLSYTELANRCSVRYGNIDTALRRLRHVGDTRHIVFHLHWEDAVYRDNPPEEAWRLARRFIATCETFTDHGGHVVWTIHNEAPHDGMLGDVHAWIVARLARLAQKVCFHCQSAADHIAPKWQISPEQVVIAPHGNYTDWFAPWDGTQLEARRLLELPEEGRMVLLFGRLGAYKGARALLRAFANASEPDTSLVIAGKQVHPVDLGSLAEDPRILIKDGFIDEDDIPPLFAAADLVAMPYRAVLTSGTTMLSMTLGRPVLAPRLFHIAEIIEHGVNGFLYDPDTPAALEDTLRGAVRSDALGQMGQKARQSADSYRWSDTAAILRTTYESLCREPKAA